MRRREFIRLLAVALTSSAGALPHAAWPEDRIRRVVVLVPLPATDPIFQRNMDAFASALTEQGWVEGHNLEMKVVSIIGSGRSRA